MKSHQYRVAALAASCVAVASTGAGTPVVQDASWSLIAEIPVDAPLAPRIHPYDGSILYLTDAADGLYRLTIQQPYPIRLTTDSRPVGLYIDPFTGDAFISQNNTGIIRRYDWADGSVETWVSAFTASDDDPNGMAVAPPGYSGPLLLPGEGIVVDQGFSGPDGAWKWSLSVPDDVRLLLDDTQPFSDLRDVTVTDSNIFMADRTGEIYTVDGSNNAVVFPVTPALVSPAGITVDPDSGDLFVYDNGDGTVRRVDPVTGSATLFLSGLTPDDDTSTPFAFAPGGGLCIAADYATGHLYLFADCTYIEDPIQDCNENGIRDLCEIDGETLFDCNNNGLADACEIAAGLVDDCNSDGVPDECPMCPPVDIVFVMDTSTSMNDEAAVICDSISALSAAIASQGIDLSADYLGVSVTPGGSFGCLTDSVINLLGTSVPGMPPMEIETLGDCPGGSAVASEDWGRATAVVAGLYPWRPNALRIVVPISDEGPWCGDPVNEMDDLATFHAIEVALAEGVILSPVLGTGSGAPQIERAQLMASSTGGTATLTTAPDQELFSAIYDVILDACFGVTDCNDNGIPDDCDIAFGYSDDDNNDGTPDECELPVDCDGNGTADIVDIFQGLLVDCNDNNIWDECETSFGITPDCNNNLIPDACELNMTGFPDTLFENTTTGDNGIFLGPPDGTFYGLGGQMVTYDMTVGVGIFDAPGQDFNVYEVNSGVNEFGRIDVSVSADGTNFISVKSTEAPWVPIPGDEDGAGSGGFTRSYDVSVAALPTVRYIRIDGNGAGGSGPTTDFDLDAIGIINAIPANDMNLDGIPDECNCPGDANMDGAVNFTDLEILLDNWGATVTPGTLGDVDASGQVNFTDLEIVLDNWATDC